jgi:hypothetical protein
MPVRCCATSRACSSPSQSLSAASKLQSTIGPASSWRRERALHATSVARWRSPRRFRQARGGQ